MAQRISENSTLKLKVRKGTDESGKGIFATRSFGNMNPDLPDDDAYSVGTKLAALSKYDVTEISRTDVAVLGEDD